MGTSPQRSANEDPQPAEMSHARLGTFTVQASTMTVQPDAILAPLSKVELEVLLEGETNPARAGRDLCLGVFFSGLFGLIALIATIDWHTAFKDAIWKPFIWVGIQFAATFASGVGAAINHSWLTRKRGISAYTDVVEKLKGHFTQSSDRYLADVAHGRT